MATTSPVPTGDVVSTVAGRHGAVTVLRTPQGYTVVAGQLDDPDRHVVLSASRAALATFAADVLAHLRHRPEHRVSVPFDQPFPISAQLVGDRGVLNLLDDGDDLVLLAPPEKRGASRLTAAQVETFAQALTEETR